MSFRQNSVLKAFVADFLQIDRYTPICARLITQFKTILKSPFVAEAFDSLDAFCATYKV